MSHPTTPSLARPHAPWLQANGLLGTRPRANRDLLRKCTEREHAMRKPDRNAGAVASRRARIVCVPAKPSPIDKFFEEIFGFRPVKAGRAYEMLAAAARKLAEPAARVLHDQDLTGQECTKPYQVDVLITADRDDWMGEAKDYTSKGSPVGRPDVQKQAGSLLDLSVSGGEFFSATGYTKPAREYAGASERIVGKPIQLYEIRPSEPPDEAGRITEICINLHACTADYDNARMEFVFASKAKEWLQAQSPGTSAQAAVGEILRDDGSVMTTIARLTEDLGGDFERAFASFWLPGGNIQMSGQLLPILGITYDVPFARTTSEIRIRAKGKASVIIRAADGSTDKLITDVDLKRIRFGDDGEVTVVP